VKPSEQHDLVERLRDAYERVQEEVSNANEEIEGIVSDLKEGAIAEYNGLIAETREKLQKLADSLEDQIAEKEQDEEWEDTDEAEAMKSLLEDCQNWGPEDLELPDQVTFEVPDQSDVADDFDSIDIS